MSEQVLKFGVEPNEVFGLIQSESRNESVEVAEARDAAGKIIEQRGYSKTEERQFEALIDANVTLPAIGTEVTVGEWSGLVTSLQKTYSNTEYAKVSVTVQKKDAAAIVGYE